MARNERSLESVEVGIRQSGGEAMVVATDVTRYSDLQNAISQTMERYGRLDILINNAGMIEPVARLGDSDPDGWCLAADVNYKGVYFGMRAAIPIMLEAGGGVIINISSGAATSALEGWSQSRRARLSK